MLDASAQLPTELDVVFFALCDQTRRGLLGRLRGVELAAGALADGFHVTRPAVSRHLRILREARLVSERRRGRERVYTLTPEPLAGVTGWLEDYRTFWAAHLSDLKALIESLPDGDDAPPSSALPLRSAAAGSPLSASRTSALASDAAPAAPAEPAAAVAADRSTSASAANLDAPRSRR
jgi:DNA-binding transcriptional ArsR family regulator